jgi:hypothetical protein
MRTVTARASRFRRFGVKCRPIAGNLQNAAMQALDKLDRQILRSLQADGRATYDQIAEAVGCRPARCCAA